MYIKDYILKHAPGNLYWKDLQGRYLGCNWEFLKISRLEKQEDIVGKTDKELFGNQLGMKGVQLLEQLDQYVMQNDIVVTKEELGINVKGEKVTYLTKKIPLKDVLGNIIGVIGTSFDITLQKEAEQAKNNFIRNMSHDIRTPLTGVIGMGEILKKEIHSEKGKKVVHNLIAAANILLDLLNSIIEFSQIETGEPPIYNTKFNMKKLVNTLVTLLMPSVQNKKIKLKINYDPKIPNYLIGDKTRTHRILLNLVSNAIKFTHIGMINISIKLAKQVNNNDENIILKFIVNDTGIGIPKDKWQSIFSKFNRLSPSYSGNYQGYGLGLPIVKQLISELSGEVKVTSEEGRGSTFTCIIPFKKASLDIIDREKISNTNMQAETNFFELKLRRQSTVNQIKKSIMNTKEICKILLIEDNLLAQQAAEHILEQANCHVTVAGNGEEALFLAKHHSYDLIFMDIGLPDKNGCDVTAEIRQWEKENNKHTIIVALTAHADKESKRQCSLAGMEGVLTKPLDEQKYQEIFKQYLYSKKPGVSDSDLI